MAVRMFATWQSLWMGVLQLQEPAERLCPHSTSVSTLAGHPTCGVKLCHCQLLLGWEMLSSVLNLKAGQAGCIWRREEACRQALQRYHEKGLPLSHCTVSTDAYGSLPVFDNKGQLVAYDVADPGGRYCMTCGWHVGHFLVGFKCCSGMLVAAAMLSK